MSSTEFESGRGPDYPGRGTRGYDGRPSRQGRGIFISTEARPGFITTEFWLTIIGVVGLVILAYSSDELDVRWGMGMATAVLVGYILSRGIAKAGSSEVVRRDETDL